MTCLKLVIDNTKLFSIEEKIAAATKKIQKEAAKEMDPDYLRVGDTIKDSPNGPGVITGVTEAGYPQVNNVAVVWVERTDGVTWGRRK